MILQEYILWWHMELEDHYDEEDHHDTRDKKMVGPTLCRACVNIRGWLCVGEKKKFIQPYKKNTRHYFECKMTSSYYHM